VSFELESERALESAMGDLRSRGIEPAQVVDSELKRSFFLRDPDGMLSEYYVRRGPGFPEMRRIPVESRPFHA
jgi:catechol 2,3-dioxygenase